MKKLIGFTLRFVPRRYIQLFAHFVTKFLSIFYAGDKVECTVCKHKYRKFLPFGRLKAARENALCPNCLSLERHRMIWYFLENKTNFFTYKQNMLHIAPEYCFIKRFGKIQNLNYITGDLESPLAMVKMNVLDIPFSDNEFDVLMCNHVLEHIEDDNKAMSEIYRVLKPAGWAILQVPIDMTLEKTYEDFTILSPSEREKHFGQNDHVRQYGSDYIKRLAYVGFNVKPFDFGTLSDDIITRFGFIKTEPLFYCEKTN